MILKLPDYYQKSTGIDEATKRQLFEIAVNEAFRSAVSQQEFTEKIKEIKDDIGRLDEYLRKKLDINLKLFEGMLKGLNVRMTELGRLEKTLEKPSFWEKLFKR